MPIPVDFHYEQANETRISDCWTGLLASSPTTKPLPYPLQGT